MYPSVLVRRKGVKGYQSVIACSIMMWEQGPKGRTTEMDREAFYAKCEM